MDGTSTFSAEFKTGNSDDSYIATMKQGYEILIIDNFAIDGDSDKQLTINTKSSDHNKRG